ncbi:hypothetical protein FHR56_003606 [Xanthomonas sacchari]|uniref:hypothetical protein n=1 Tax=unclassified Xanthomonas TaxID=2643310 RepID=UPI00136C4830|nr:MULTISPECIES: hypothetical protein [unclassified Xanthomonas]MBB6368427.1 hypothetical protein [Xanthomonas sp. F10]
MKLIGSLMEDGSSKELSKSWDGLREPGNQLFEILKDAVGFISSAFVLNWTPEQSEDIYTVLVNGREVILFEVSKSSGEVLNFRNVSVKEYEKSLRSRQSKIKLAVAIELASKQ